MSAVLLHNLIGVRGYFRDFLAIAVATTPVYAVLEVHMFHMSVSTSAFARTLTVTALFLGLGQLICVCRDFSHRFFGLVPGSTKNIILVPHDLAFMALINGALAPIVYFLSDATARQLLHGIFTAMAVSFVTGPLVGFSIDTFRELMGVKPVRRLPHRLAQISQRGRFVWAAFVVALSTLVVASSYLTA